MKLRLTACAAIAIALGTVPAQAFSNESAGTAVAVALPLVAGGITLYKRDWTGTAQAVVSTVLTVGTVYGLKHIVRECRPFAVTAGTCSSNRDSFPSDTSALAFAPAEFLRERYGWQYGLPAYAAAAYVGWSRVDAQKHHWYDVATSFGISLLYNEIITTRYHPKRGFYTDLDADSRGVYASLNYRW
jgi:membrane-associated phospholipid phosphatase